MKMVTRSGFVTSDEDVAFSCELSPFRLGEYAQGMSEACSKKHCGNDEDEQGCVPGSENNILCVAVRDRGFVQPIAGEGGSRTSKDVFFDFMRRRRRLRIHEKKYKVNQNKKEEIRGRENIRKTDARREKRSWQ